MGQMDIPLDETGLRQVQWQQRLKVEQPAIIYSSGLQRATTRQRVHQAAIADSDRRSARVKSDARLRRCISVIGKV
jgi:broad specificity phosphatase PhoE